MTAAGGSPSVPHALGVCVDRVSREALSALADGEMPAADVAAACRGCAGHAEAMADWHAWHLIGDVLRSDDLATTGDHDARFLAALRVRLAQEPVVLAPSPVVEGAVAAPSRDSGWRRFGVVPSAMAAGFALVAAGLIGVRFMAPGPVPSPSYAVEAGLSPGQPVQASRTLLAAEPAVQRVQANAMVAAEPQVMVANSKLIRDARLDRYLAAHQQFAGDTALTVPTAFLRNAAVDAPR